MAYQYTPGDQAVGLTTYHADGSQTTVTTFYRPQNGNYVKLPDTQTSEGPPISFTQFRDQAKASLDIGEIVSSFPVWRDNDGHAIIGTDFIEGLRCAVASGQYTQAQAEQLLINNKCITTITGASYLSTAPDTIPLAVGESFFIGQAVDAVELLRKTVGTIDDHELMATYSNGGNMPWSIPAGQTVQQAAQADWNGTVPTVYTPGTGAIDTAAGIKLANTITQGVTGATQTTLIDNKWLTHAHVDSAEQVYLAYFGRPADVAGIRTTEDQITAANGDKAAITSMFANSSESAAFYAGKTTEQKVETVYNQLFNRAAEKAGLDYWVHQLDLGLMNQVNMCIKILDGAQNSDKTIVNNRVDVAKYFTEKVSATAYDGLTAASNARELLSSIGADAGDVTKAKAVIDSTGYNTDLKSGDVTDDITLVGLTISPYFHG